MKDKQDIEDIISRYWDGDTSLEEEAQMRAALQEESSLDPAALALTTFFQKEKQVQSTRPLEIPAQAKVRSLWSRYRALAAVLVVALGAFFFLQQGNVTSTSDTFQDPDQAFAEVVEALQFISGKMNSGMTTAGSSLEKVQPLDDIFN
ncbi:MAG: hypothetical protein KTR24_17335 [Saprospiraceae bacterium]|nr:hypothetical protein [Saprospiraceae bacterium]